MTASELNSLTNALRIPPRFKTASGHVYEGIEALSLLCARFRSPGDIYDLVRRYDRSASAISEVINELCVFLDESWAHLLHLDSQGVLAPERLQEYADALHDFGAPVDSVWGFLDCTIRQMCRPIWWQGATYNGHKKFHALKFQAVMLVNGIIGHLYGPVEGRRNDNFLLVESGLLEWCRSFAIRPGIPDDVPPEERYLQLFGDSAYGVSYQILSPFAGLGERTEEEKMWNQAMSKPRMSVEHGFGIVVSTWPFLNAFWKLRVYQSPIGRYYRVAVLLTNAINCYRPNLIAQRFDCLPPTLEEYFHE